MCQHSRWRQLTSVSRVAAATRLEVGGGRRSAGGRKAAVLPPGKWQPSVAMVVLMLTIPTHSLAIRYKIRI